MDLFVAPAGMYVGMQSGICDEALRDHTFRVSSNLLSTLMRVLKIFINKVLLLEKPVHIIV